MRRLKTFEYKTYRTPDLNSILKKFDNTEWELVSAVPSGWTSSYVDQFQLVFKKTIYSDLASDKDDTGWPADNDRL